MAEWERLILCTCNLKSVHDTFPRFASCSSSFVLGILSFLFFLFFFWVCGFDRLPQFLVLNGSSFSASAGGWCCEVPGCGSPLSIGVPRSELQFFASVHWWGHCYIVVVNFFFFFFLRPYCFRLFAKRLSYCSGLRPAVRILCCQCLVDLISRMGGTIDTKALFFLLFSGNSPHRTPGPSGVFGRWFRGLEGVILWDIRASVQLS